MHRSLPFGILSAIFSLVSSASAAIITQTQGFVGTPAVQKRVAFDRFNPSYGQLQGAEWRFVLSIEGGSLTLDNDQPESQQVRVQFGASGILRSLDVHLLASDQQPLFDDSSKVVSSTNQAIDLAADDGDGSGFDPQGPDVITLWGSTTTASLTGWVDAAYLGDYVGNQLFDVQVDIASFVAAGSPHVASEVNPLTVWPNVMLIYHFTPVPEPSGFSVCGLAAAGAGFWRARRRSHRVFTRAT
jgi:hypothetical protein